MTRIKYSRFGNLLVTDFITVGPNNIVRGVIDSGFIYSLSSFDGEIISKGQASNLRNAKIAVRKLLLQHGAKLNTEIRNSKLLR
jgi:hypothetical protein